MIKKISILLSLVLFVWLVADVSTRHLHSRTSGAPAGSTGGPAESGRTCATTGCHSSPNPQNLNDVIITDISDLGYQPGELYNITVKFKRKGHQVFGFQLSNQDNQGNQVGTLLPQNSDTKVVSSKYITHTASGTNGTDSIEWNFKWQAPTGPSESVGFYLALNATNANGSKTGDSIFVSSDFYTQSPIATSIKNQQQKLGVYPNPASDVIFLRDSEVGTLFIYNAQGQIIQNLSPKPNEAINIQHLSPGIYTLANSSGTFAERFIKK